MSQEEVYGDLADGAEHSTEVQKWADVAMWEAAPLATEDEPMAPSAYLVSMTPDPLRTMAAACQMYKGDLVVKPSDIPQDMALRWLREMTQTRLQAGLEFIDIHLAFTGVTRAFTHQLVRQRTAVYVQESLRFAVKTNARFEVRMPPSIERLKEDDPQRMQWDYAVATIGEIYNQLIGSGVPAEDARGLLPTNIGTQVHYKTNLRNLIEQAGSRLCSQAQFEWKEVWLQIIQQIISYGPDVHRWQQYAIAGLFKPICFQTGKCEFMGSNDRHCDIRDRVQAHHAAGEPSRVWLDIDPMEPLREGAARRAPGEDW